MAKQDRGSVRANLAMTRQAIANASRRGVPKFKHPKRSAPPSPAPEPAPEAPKDESAPAAPDGEGLER